MDGFGIDEMVESDGEDDSWKDEIDENFLRTFVRYSRANQVSNEPQAVVALYGYASGLLPNWEDYLGILIRGGTSSGKTHMKQEVLDAAFQYADREFEWLYTMTSGSDKSMVDDEEIDESRIGAFNEFQQMPKPLVEIIKRIVEDGGYTYGRNVSDPDSESGRKTVKVSRDPMPIIFSLADENEANVEAEMQSRMVTVQVDEGPEKNRAVHKMKHGHKNIELANAEHEYVRESPELDHAVKKHIKNIPVDTDVVIPTGDERFDGDVGDSQSESTHGNEDSSTPRDDWDESAVTEPMFNFARSESTRASAAISSMVKASTLLNYHSRETVTDGDGRSHSENDASLSEDSSNPAGDEYLVAEPQDVANVLMTRKVLLATTHNLTAKKFIVLEAFIEEGASYSSPEASSNAKQISKQGVINYIQQRSDIPTFSKSVVSEILDELDEDLVINKMDHPEDARKNIYVYDPSTQFGRPNIYDYYDKFEDADDVIKDQPIETTIEEQLEEVNALMSTDDLAEKSESESDAPNDNSGGLDDFAEDSSTELSEVATAVHEEIAWLDGKWVPARVRESDDLRTAHMLGITPVDEYEGENANEELVDMIEPEREPTYKDKEGTIFHPEHDLWGEENISDIESRIDEAIYNELVDAGVLSVGKDDVGNVTFTVTG